MIPSKFVVFLVMLITHLVFSIQCIKKILKYVKSQKVNRYEYGVKLLIMIKILTYY